MSAQPQSPRSESGEAPAPPVWVKLPPAMRAALFDPALWHESLDAYAARTRRWHWSMRLVA
jgi:hypothetical protein